MSEDSVDRIIRAWAERDPALDTSALEVVGRLLLCAQHCERLIVAALRPHGLSFGDFDVLNTLRRRGDPHGTRPTSLAASSLITSGAMTSRLDRLERAGLIIRSPDPADRRGVLVRLSDPGEELAKRALKAVFEADNAFLEPLTPQHRRSLAATLKRLLLPLGPGHT